MLFILSKAGPGQSKLSQGLVLYINIMGLKISEQFLPDHSVFPISRTSIHIFVTSSKFGRFSSNKIHEHTNEAVSTNFENSEAPNRGERGPIEFSNITRFQTQPAEFYKKGKGNPCSLTTHLQ